MFLNLVASLFISALLSSEAYVSPSCAELERAREEAEAAAARLGTWMEHHCPGALEDTEPFCRLQSRALLEQLVELGELKAAHAAKGCELREVRDAGAQGRASLIHLATTP